MARRFLRGLAQGGGEWLAGETETDMRARRSSAFKAIGRNLGEGLMWMAIGWYGTYLPTPWTQCVSPPPEPPCLPPLSQEELARWHELVGDL